MLNQARLARLGASAALALVIGPAATAQAPWWPRFQRDARNSGSVPLPGFATDVHVAWAAQLSAPIAGEHYATPVLSNDNSRVYIGGPQSRLSAVNLADGALLWSVHFGDSTGSVFCAPAVGADGSVFVGAWDAQAPYDGFVKVRDDGGSAAVVWRFPIRRMIASPTITPTGLIIIGGQHETDGWRYFALRDDGDSCTVAWTAALQADPANPSSTGRIGAAAGLSPDGAQVYGSSDQNRTVWQVAAAEGGERARIAMNAYCYSGTPAVTTSGEVFVAEGQSFGAPNDLTEGRLHIFSLDAAGMLQRRFALPLQNGHLNGGVALREMPSGRTRVYVAANGNGKSAAKLIGVEFDPLAELADPPQPLLRKLWEAPVGPPAFTYPHPLACADATIYTIGPVDHTFYALRDVEPGSDEAGNPTPARAAVLWSLPLAEISRVGGWTPLNQRGPLAPLVAPDGTILWNAPDGYLYALRGWRSGDLNGDELVDSADQVLLGEAAADRADYALRFPEIELDRIADLDGDGDVDAADAERLSLLLNP